MSPRLRLMALAAVVAGLFALVALSGNLSTARVREAVDGLGGLAPPAFVLVAAALTLASVPGPLLAGASGLLFGTALGFPLALFAGTLGASLAFSIARKGGAGAVEELAGPRVRAIEAWVSRRGFLAVLYARIAPAMPFALVSYAAGLSRVRLRDFVGATALGAAPRAFAYTALGGSLKNLTSPEAIVAVAVLVLMAVGGLVLARRAQLRERTEAVPPSSSAR